MLDNGRDASQLGAQEAVLGEVGHFAADRSTWSFTPIARLRPPVYTAAMADLEGQDRVCGFVRDIIASRIGETLEISARPDVDDRNLPAVEELWDSVTRRFAIEHTRLETFEGQIANSAKIERILVPVKQMLAGRVPGRFVLAVSKSDILAARGRYEAVHAEIVRLVLEVAPQLDVEENRTLQSDDLPFAFQLHLRHRNDSSVVLYTDIDGTAETLRLDRMRRALDAKCPKLVRWASEGRTSILALETNDIQHSNAFVNYEAFQRAAAERKDLPDIVVLVETEVHPMYGWVFKDGNHFGDEVAMPDERRCYTEGEVEAAT